MGQSYVLGCPEGGEKALMAAVASVDREMNAIRTAGKVRARERIAVLAALNLAYALAQRPATDASSPDIVGVDVDALIKRVDEALAPQGSLL